MISCPAASQIQSRTAGLSIAVRNRASLARSCSSARRRSPMSRLMPIKPEIVPAASRTGARILRHGWPRRRGGSRSPREWSRREHPPMVGGPAGSLREAPPFLRQEAHMRAPGTLADRVLQHVAAGGTHPEIERQALDHGCQSLGAPPPRWLPPAPAPWLRDAARAGRRSVRQSPAVPPAWARLGSMRLRGHDAQRAEPRLSDASNGTPAQKRMPGAPVTSGLAASRGSQRASSTAIAPGAARTCA